MVSKIFSKPKTPKVDTSALKAQQKLLNEQREAQRKQEEKLAADERKQKLKTEAAQRARRGRSSGGRSLLFGLETGVEPAQERRGQLG